MMTRNLGAMTFEDWASMFGEDADVSCGRFERLWHVGVCIKGRTFQASKPGLLEAMDAVTTEWATNTPMLVVDLSHQRQ